MEVLTVKKNLHQLIDKIQDAEYLNDLYDSLKSVSSLKKDVLDDLSPIQMKRLDESIKQISQGALIENKHVKEKYKEWLTK
jgi:hypothetical protein